MKLIVIRTFSILVLTLMITVIFSDIVTAQEFEQIDTSSPLLTLLNVQANQTNDLAVNISDEDHYTNFEAWDDFKDYFEVNGKLLAPETLPSSVDIDGSGGYEISSMVKLPSAFFMQGVQTSWVRTPIEWFNGMDELTVTIRLIYNEIDPFQFSSVEYLNTFDVSSPSIGSNIPGVSTDVKTRDWGIDYYYYYDYLYVKIDCPLYSDLTYMFSFDTGTDHPRALFTPSDNGMEGLRWSSVDGEIMNLSASIDILGVNGFSDGFGGFFCPAGTSIEYKIIIDYGPVPTTKYFNLFIPFAKAFTGVIDMPGLFSDTITEPDKAYYLTGTSTSGSGVYDRTLTIEFDTDNYIWLRDIYYPFNDIGTTYPFPDNHMHFDNLGWIETVYFPPYVVFQDSSGIWDNIPLDTVYEMEYIYDTTYIYEEIGPTLNKDSIYYGFYKFGEYVAQVGDFTWDVAVKGIQIVWDMLPESIQGMLTKIWEWGAEVGQASLEFSNWMAKEISELGQLIFSVGVEIYEWIVDHIPALQNILTKLLRVILAVMIIALFLGVVFVMWKFLNTFRILATGGLEEAVEYASSITLYQDIRKAITGGIDLVT